VGDEAPASDSESLPLKLAGCIDRACNRYEAEWKLGRRPRIEAYLTDATERERPGLFRELLLLEIEFRESVGERPAPEEYRARFSGHDTLIRSVFEVSCRARDATARPWARGPAGPGVGNDPAIAPDRSRPGLPHESDQPALGSCSAGVCRSSAARERHGPR
jgi:hypothetical protein